MYSSLIKRNRVKFKNAALVVGPFAVKAASEAHAAACSGSDQGEASVSIKRKGDAIEAIEVLCPCGNEIILECIYPDTGESS